MNKQYDQFIQKDNDYLPAPGDISVAKKLPPGSYQLQQDPNGQLHIMRFDIKHDELVDLPNTEYDNVVSELELFMEPDTKEKFKKNGYLYKHSVLLYGLPGSGKTCIVDRVALEHIKRGGVVFFNPHPLLLPNAYEILTSVQPETPVLVIFEELDTLLKSFEGKLLNILDGEIQKDNVIYMATTNHINDIPTRIRRPGRFSIVVEVKFPSAETRGYYVKQKLGEIPNLEEWVTKTEGFSIDEVKEAIRSVTCLNYTLDEITQRINANKNDTKTPADRIFKVAKTRGSVDDGALMSHSEFEEKSVGLVLVDSD